MARNSRRGSDATCIVCCHVIDNTTRFLTVGVCGHLGCCSLCALRMRQLMRNTSCPICKAELPRVICIREETESFDSFVFWGQDEDNIGPSHVFDELSGIFFLQSNYPDIQKLRHPFCPKAPHCKFQTTQVAKLQAHLKDVHHVEFCGICLKHKQVFLQEQPVFTKDGLKHHCQDGDPSQGFVGHPKCDFCQNRFYSNLELYDHLHRNHFECDLCSRHLGIEHRYYRDYPDLENHFRKDHFLCEESTCLAKKFVVFSSHLDFQAHMTKEHPHIKMSRKIDVHFTVKRATRDASHRQDQQEFESFGALTTTGPGTTTSTGRAEENLINVADFPSLSATQQSSGQLLLWDSQRLNAPTMHDFPELPSSSSASTSGQRVGASAFRNALAPPPTPAMLAHMQNDNEWEYPELASAVAALGVNNPMLRFVKPAKKQKKKNKHKSNQQQQQQPSSATLAVNTSQDQQQDDAEDEEEGKPNATTTTTTTNPAVAGPSRSPHSKTQLVLHIRQKLGSDEKYEQFRECCKQYRLGQVDVESFYPKVRAMFTSQQDFDQLFVALMQMSPDQNQIATFLQFHQQMQSNHQPTGKTKKKPKAKSKHQPKQSVAAAAPSERPASAGATMKRRQVPMATGWSSALRQSGISPSASSGRSPGVVINNKKSEANVSKWSSSTSPDLLVDPRPPPPHQRAVTPPPVAAPVTRPLTPEVMAPPPAAAVAVAAPPPAQPKSFSLKRNQEDFPGLPTASKPIGLQAVTRATWDEQLQAIVQNRSDNSGNAAPKNKPRKQKKKTMTLGEMAMQFR